ncbi:MAG: hypothetical protein K2M45_04410 [Muribaculaceae bacterium]|nr:hypothetical protein [Muribaculaceae bacterium]
MKILAFLPSQYLTDLGATLPVAPILSFPDSSIIKNGNPFFIPDFDTDFSTHIYFAIKISRLGKSIAPRFAERYYSEIAPALTVKADNLLAILQRSGLPWTSAVGFDKSVAIGEFINYSEEDSFTFTIHADGQEAVSIPVPDKKNISDAIAEASRYNSLKMGDLILIPAQTPDIRLIIGERLTAVVNDEELLKFPIK